MPWRSPMSAREALIFEVNQGKTVSEAAQDHGVARSCAAKWVARYREYGLGVTRPWGSPISRHCHDGQEDPVVGLSGVPMSRDCQGGRAIRVRRLAAVPISRYCQDGRANPLRRLAAVIDGFLSSTS